MNECSFVFMILPIVSKKGLFAYTLLSCMCARIAYFGHEYIWSEIWEGEEGQQDADYQTVRTFTTLKALQIPLKLGTFCRLISTKIAAVCY